MSDNPRPSRPWQAVARDQVLLAASQVARLSALREVVLVVVVSAAYFLTRGLIEGRESVADDHARWLLDIERVLHLQIEPPVQRLTLDHAWLLHALNGFYLAAHLPVLITVAVWLYVWHPPGYRRFRNAFLVSAVIGLLCYVLFPVAPPRFLPGFVDTMRLDSFDVDGSAAGAFYNPYAAMPSLHVGWSLLAGGAVVAYARAWWLRVLGALLPAVMTLTVIGTGNHFLLDAVGGAAVATGSYLLTAWRPHRPRNATAGRLPDGIGPAVEHQGPGDD